MAVEGNNLKLMWVPVHTGIKKNEEADEAAKESLEQEVKISHKVDKADCSGWTRKKNV
jgi:ribonuclease HI